MKLIKDVSISQFEAVWNDKSMNPAKFEEVVKVRGSGAGEGKDGCPMVGCEGGSAVFWCAEVGLFLFPAR